MEIKKHVKLNRPFFTWFCLLLSLSGLVSFSSVAQAKYSMWSGGETATKSTGTQPIRVKLVFFDETGEHSDYQLPVIGPWKMLYDNKDKQGSIIAVNDGKVSVYNCKNKGKCALMMSSLTGAREAWLKENFTLDKSFLAQLIVKAIEETVGDNSWDDYRRSVNTALSKGDQELLTNQYYKVNTDECVAPAPVCSASGLNIHNYDRKKEPADDLSVVPTAGIVAYPYTKNPNNGKKKICGFEEVMTSCGAGQVCGNNGCELTISTRLKYALGLVTPPVIKSTIRSEDDLEMLLNKKVKAMGDAINKASANRPFEVGEKVFVSDPRGTAIKALYTSKEVSKEEMELLLKM